MDHEAAATGAVRIDQGIDRAIDSGARQYIDDKLAFPSLIILRLPVLDGAAAAPAEVIAERRDPLRAGVHDAQQLQAIRLAGERRGFDGFSGERVGHESRLAIDQCDTVAALADMIDP